MRLPAPPRPGIGVLSCGSAGRSPVARRGVPWRAARLPWWRSLRGAGSGPVSARY